MEFAQIKYMDYDARKSEIISVDRDTTFSPTWRGSRVSYDLTIVFRGGSSKSFAYYDLSERDEAYSELMNELNKV